LETALFEIDATEVDPDATFSLRLLFAYPASDVNSFSIVALNSFGSRVAGAIVLSIGIR
jgi:hypothetical protein